jgi:hypothetical protein
LSREGDLYEVEAMDLARRERVFFALVRFHLRWKKAPPFIACTSFGAVVVI